MRSLLGLLVGEDQVRGVRRGHPRPGRGRVVAGRGVVGGRGLRPVGEQDRRAPVPADAHRQGSGLVGDPAHDVVGEAVARAVGEQEPGPGRASGPVRALLDAHPAQRGDLVEPERRPEHGGLGQQHRDVLGRRGEPARQGLLQRAGDGRGGRVVGRRVPSGGAGLGVAEQLADQQRRAPGPGREALEVLLPPGTREQGTQRVPGQRPDVEDGGDVAQRLRGAGRLGGPLGRDDQHPAGRPGAWRGRAAPRSSSARRARGPRRRAAGGASRRPGRTAPPSPRACAAGAARSATGRAPGATPPRRRGRRARRVRAPRAGHRPRAPVAATISRTASASGWR